MRRLKPREFCLPKFRTPLRACSSKFAGEDQPPLQLTADEEASFDESLAQAERGEFATDEQMRAIWTKHGL